MLAHRLHVKHSRYVVIADKAESFERIENCCIACAFHENVCSAPYSCKTLFHDRGSGRLVRGQTPCVALLGAGVHATQPNEAAREPAVLPAPWVLMVRRIRDLLYEQGFTISGARIQLENSKNRMAEQGHGAPDIAVSSVTGSLDDAPVETFGQMSKTLDATATDSIDWAALRRELEAIRILLN